MVLRSYGKLVMVQAVCDDDGGLFLDVVSRQRGLLVRIGPFPDAASLDLRFRETVKLNEGLSDE
jgi:hypothetical protein